MKKYLLFLPFFIFQSCIFCFCDDDADDLDFETAVAYQYRYDYRDGEKIPGPSRIYYFKQQDSLKPIDSLKEEYYLGGFDFYIEKIKNNPIFIERLDPYDTIFKYLANDDNVGMIVAW